MVEVIVITLVLILILIIIGIFFQKKRTTEKEIKEDIEKQADMMLKLRANMYASMFIFEYLKILKNERLKKKDPC